MRMTEYMYSTFVKAKVVKQYESIIFVYTVNLLIPRFCINKGTRKESKH